MSTLDYHTTGIDDEHMTASEHDDKKPPLQKRSLMLLITVIIDCLIAIITAIICCAYMIISMIHGDATMTSAMRDFLIPFITVLIGNWINMIMDMIMDRTCPME